MKLAQALRALGDVPVGLTSFVAAPETLRDFPPHEMVDRVDWTQEALAAAVKACDAALDRLKDQMADCHSDAAYWGYAGQGSHWKAIHDILIAALRVGPENLPDVLPPANAGVLMDMMAQQERYGTEILQRALEMPLPAPAQPTQPPQAEPQPEKVIVTIGLGITSKDRPVPPGMHEHTVEIDENRLYALGHAFMKMATALLQAGEHPAAIMAGLQYAIGAMMGGEKVFIEPDTPVSALGAFMMGYDSGTEARDEFDRAHHNGDNPEHPEAQAAGHAPKDQAGA